VETAISILGIATCLNLLVTLHVHSMVSKRHLKLVKPKGKLVMTPSGVFRTQEDGREVIYNDDVSLYDKEH
jgi:hypothetical protein